MAKVPDFGWKWDSENLGENMELDGNTYVQKVKNNGVTGKHSSAIVNYILNDDVGTKCWRIRIQGGTLAVAFGVIPVKFYHEAKNSNVFHNDFFGICSHGFMSDGNGLIPSKFCSFSSLLNHGFDVYVKYEKNTLSCYHENLETKEIIIENIPQDVCEI
eukprot:TRINITY_DN3433_c1_g1_i3.p1 TRINITY_DN3433_c1_g1~~TRINITY_DN3433_c1_g1_i3.p1  ORF type:complete len:159 (+),score=38.86 TRINITY_DN3433_c1_g1_i3:195-671(+)